MVISKLASRRTDSNRRFFPPARLKIRRFRETSLEVSSVSLVEVTSGKRGNREILTLFVETVTGVATRVVLVLDVGVRLAITKVDSNIAVVARELRIMTNKVKGTSLFRKVENTIENP